MISKHEMTLQDVADTLSSVAAYNGINVEQVLFLDANGEKSDVDRVILVSSSTGFVIRVAQEVIDHAGRDLAEFNRRFEADLAAKRDGEVGGAGGGQAPSPDAQPPT